MNPARALRRVAEPSPCGSLWLELGGGEVALRCSGALWIEGERVLAAGDLHLEKGSAYAARGQLLPPYDTRATLDRLEAEIAVLAPRTLVLMGDSFHDARGVSRLGETELRRILDLARGRALVWLVGNHDREGLDAMPGETLEALALAGLHLRHDPQPGFAPGEVAGHLHPCAKVRGPGGVLRRRCFLTDGERLILPAFGAYAGGLNARDPAFDGLFVRPPIAGVIGPNRVHPIPWGNLVGD